MNSLFSTTKRDVRLPTPLELHQLGLDKSILEVSNTLEEHRTRTPAMVVATCKKSVDVSLQGNVGITRLEKKKVYVMSLGVFLQLYYDPEYGIHVLKPAKFKFKKAYRPYIGQDLSGKTLLVWRTGGVGDLLFIQPSLRYLKEKFPTSRILFACNAVYHPMVETWPCVDKILDLPFQHKFLVESDYHAIFEGVIERCKDSQRVNSYVLFSTWLGLDLPTSMLVPKQEAKQSVVSECKSILGKFDLEDKSFIACQLRASSPVRTPSLEVWKRLINELTERGHKIVIFDAPRMDEVITSFISSLKHKDRVVNFCSYSTSLDYSIALISLSKLVLAPDSAGMHIAESLGVKSFGIYGPFPARVRLSTYNNASWFECKAPCSPCFLHGSNPCPKATRVHSPCFESLDEKFVSDRIEEHLGCTKSS